MESDNMASWGIGKMQCLKNSTLHLAWRRIRYIFFYSYLIIKSVMDRSRDWRQETIEARLCRSVADLSTQDRQFRATQPWPSGCPRNMPSPTLPPPPTTNNITYKWTLSPTNPSLRLTAKQLSSPYSWTHESHHKSWHFPDTTDGATGAWNKAVTF